MSSGCYRQAAAKCPFFKWMENKSIGCEGILDESTIITKFQYKADWDIHTKTFCCKNYINCELYRMLMDNKYDEVFDDETWQEADCSSEEADDGLETEPRGLAGSQGHA